MKKFILKSILYIFLIILSLEIIVRVSHLYTEDPPRYIDKYGVEKRVPRHNGYAVTGNRNQNFSEFRINNAGFNSSKDFTPSANKFEVAIIGDSFIEGFHQDYYNSTGKKIEDNVPGIDVYEYGYAGYDLANQMHLIYSYKEEFDLIDEIIIYLNYENDLKRDKYQPDTGRIAMLSSRVFKIRDNIKLLAYGSKIGVLDPIKNMITGGNAFHGNINAYQTNEVISPEKKIKRDVKYLNNFKNLVKLYGYDKNKTTILLDSRKTSNYFLNYCNENNFKYIDFADVFKKSEKPTTLIYDWHWNDHGRTLIAKVVSDNIKKVHFKD